MRIFITGSTGFVGINTVFRLKKKHELTLLVRNINKAKLLFGDDVELVKGDLSDIPALKRCADRADCVVHIAGLIKSQKIDELYRINHIGSRNVAEVTAEAGIKNVIYISSLAARGPENINHPVSHYGYSKRFGEYEFLRYHYDSHLKILRPTIVYGPYERWFLSLFKAAERGVAFAMDKPLLSFVHVYDLTKAIEILLDFKPKRPVIYTLSDGFAYMWDEINEYIFDAVGKKKRLVVKMPLSVVKAAVYLLDMFGVDYILTPDKLREIEVESWYCNFDKLNEDTGFHPDFTLEEGLRRTYRWYKEHEWL